MHCESLHTGGYIYAHSWHITASEHSLQNTGKKEIDRRYDKQSPSISLLSISAPIVASWDRLHCQVSHQVKDLTTDEHSHELCFGRHMQSFVRQGFLHCTLLCILSNGSLNHYSKCIAASFANQWDHRGITRRAMRHLWVHVFSCS